MHDQLLNIEVARLQRSEFSCATRIGVTPSIESRGSAGRTDSDCSTASAASPIGTAA